MLRYTPEIATALYTGGLLTILLGIALSFIFSKEAPTPTARLAQSSSAEQYRESEDDVYCCIIHTFIHSISPVSVRSLQIVFTKASV